MNIKKFLLKNKLEILLLLGIVLVAFGLYAIPSQTYPNINEFDPFYHARVVRELVKTGSIPQWEYMSYWPEGMPMRSLYPHLWHYLLAIAYWAVAFLTTGSFAYSRTLFPKVVSWVMPFVGAFGVASMYLLAKEIRSKKAGVAAAIMFMFQQNWMYKTMYSEIEEDALGLSLMLFSLFAYIYALKRGGWKNALFAGLALTAMLLTWRGAVYAAVLVSMIAIWQGIKAVLNKEHAMLEQTTETFGLSIIPVAVFGFLLDSVQQDVIYVIGIMGIAITLLVVANYWINYHNKKSKATFRGIEKEKVYKAASALLVLGVIVAGAVYGNFLLQRSIGGLETSVGSDRLGNTVAEDHPMTLDGVIGSLGIFGIFGIIALAYFPLRGFLRWKDTKNHDLIVGVFLAASLIQFLGMNKMQYFFAPASMLAIGIVLADSITLSKRLGRWAKRIAIIIVLALLMAQATIGFVQMEQMKNSYPVQPGWFKAMDFMRTMTPKNASLLTWWDYGHWTAFLGERHAIVDNTNIHEGKVTKVADIFTEYRANSTAALEKRILPQLKAFKVDYVAVDRILLTSKWGALTYIAQRQCIPTRSLAAYGLSFPQLTGISQKMCGYGYTYSGEIGIANCQKKTVISEFGNDTHYECSFIKGSAVQFTEEEWNEIKNATWPGYPLTISAANGQTISMRVYGTPDNKIMFFHAGPRILYDAPVNYMYGFELFFKAPGFKHHKLVKNQYLPNEEVVMYKVDY